jgi:4-hydroxy-3-methylbut-2-enyl diphosphate reductase
MQITVAKTAGFCFGVKRALELVKESLKSTGSPIHSLGPLIHNPAVVKDLENQGLRLVNRIDEISDGRVVIRSHGAGPGIYKYAVETGLEIIDATCPFVKNVHELALILKREGYQVIIIGESDHAEVRGVLETLSGDALVISKPEDLTGQKIGLKVGIISQTTQDVAKFQELVAAILPETKECRVFNTICLATAERQQEAAKLSRQVDLMIIVGGKNSANTNRLAEISSGYGTPTYQVESADEIKAEWFRHIEKVGITAGASTPDEHITAVVNRIKSF